MTIAFQAYMGATPSWTALASNLTFSGLATYQTEVEVGEWQDGTHDADLSTPVENCGANHPNNVKYVSDTEYSLNGGPDTELNDTNLGEDECTIRVYVSGLGSVSLSNARFYSYSTEEGIYQPAPGMDIEAYERGGLGAGWTMINAQGFGGDNLGEYLPLYDKDDGTNHYYYIAISVSPHATGDHSFRFGFSAIYS